MQKNLNRCDWAKNELEIHYHDTDWGIPKKEDHKLFYMLILEGMQAGLSWQTILNKWDAFFEVFDQFDPVIIQNYHSEKIEELMQDQRIIRNRLKIEGTVKNAKAFLQVQKEFGSFSNYLWSYVDHTPIQNHWSSLDQVPASTKLSEKISKDLKKRGFTFVGPTIIYAYMQSVGMVNDHLIHCSCYEKCRDAGTE